MSSLRIAVIGANGQVGAETCLFLKQCQEIDVIPISRSLYGSSLLRRCGLECRHGSVDSQEGASQLLGDCDMVVNFALPKGSTTKVRAATRHLINSTMACAPRVRRYVYMSTMSIYRLNRRDPLFRTYGALKRYAEKLTLRAGKRAGKSIFILRLGQVHGELQNVSRSFLRQMRGEEALVTAGPSNTVFVYSVAEAIRQIASGIITPGTYTLVSNPPWSWAEIHGYYAKRCGIVPRVRERPLPAARFEHRIWRNLMKLLKTELAAAAYHNRDIVDNCLGQLSPYWQMKLRIAYGQQRVARAIGDDPDLLAWAPYPEEFIAPGKRISSLSDSRQSMKAEVEAVQRILAGISAFPGLHSANNPL
jgi:nucleoside-diphosphate-sugar epimerase